MNPTITTYLSELHLGSMQSFQNMDVIPIFVTHNGGPEYITLKDALDKNFITITELSQSGSVPELKVINKSAHLILLIDGEELIGAKQNRVLNTSVLLRGEFGNHHSSQLHRARTMVLPLGGLCRLRRHAGK